MAPDSPDPARGTRPIAPRPQPRAGTAPLRAGPAPPSPSAEGLAPLAPGAVVDGRYRLVDRLGAGGMGEVWEAYQASTGQRVALKLLRPELASNPRAIARFQREREALARMRHRSVVKLRDAGTTPDGRGYLVMELVRGVPVSRRLAEARAAGSAWPAERLWAVAREVATVLAEAHAVGLVHRDLKDEHVLHRPLVPGVEGGDHLAVLDFGIAALQDDAVSSGRLTRTGDSPGTPRAMAPEQLRGERPAPAVDVYAFGLLLYGWLAGRPPFRARTEAEWVAAHLEHAPEPLPPAEHPVERLLGRLAFACLAKSPSARPEDGAALVAALDAPPGTSLSAARQGAGSSASLRWARGAWALATAALVVGLVAWATATPSQVPHLPAPPAGRPGLERGARAAPAQAAPAATDPIEPRAPSPPPPLASAIDPPPSVSRPSEVGAPRAAPTDPPPPSVAPVGPRSRESTKAKAHAPAPRPARRAPRPRPRSAPAEREPSTAPSERPPADPERPRVRAYEEI